MTFRVGIAEYYGIEWQPWRPVYCWSTGRFIVERRMAPPFNEERIVMSDRFASLQDAERYCAMLALGGEP